ncbi:MAG TPA: CPBP family intramembrane metalloprotease, partial [Euryarchaeota archaeon]|nr:CPBP family intramembrane metalloprotease [Euryarchaeota archaeon]
MDKITVIPRDSKAKILYKLVAYLMGFLSLIVFISFPLVFASLPAKFRNPVIFTIFGAIPLFSIPENIAYYLIVIIYGIIFAYFTYFLVRGDIDRIYLMAEGFFLAFLLTIIFSFVGEIYKGNPEQFAKDLVYKYSFYVLLAPLFEEISFRVIMVGVPLAIIFLRIKYLFGGIKKEHLKVGYALVIISGAIFGIAHHLWGGWGSAKAIPATVQGIYLGLLFIYYDFFAGLTLHFITNAISF